MNNVIEVKELRTQFAGKNGVITAVDDISFSIKEGETLCLVGESGCGKSVTAMSILRLLPKMTSKISNGQILFKGEDLVKISDDEMIKIRGNEISMIFQDSMTGLNPVLTIGFQIAESIKIHSKEKLSKVQITEKVIEILKKVGIPSPEQRIKEYPHQLSGGMRQRVMIAMALVGNISLLIADEPTTALDVTIQAQILNLMRELQAKSNTSILLITHDMGVVAEMADRVIVMYAGKEMEISDVKSLFLSPLHPYSRGLLASIPRLNQNDDERLFTINGNVPDLSMLPKGCRFCTRCIDKFDLCEKEEPPLFNIGNRAVRCWKYKEVQNV